MLAADQDQLVRTGAAAQFRRPRCTSTIECMRVFETIGLARAIEPTVHVSPGMPFIDAEGLPVLEWPRPQARTAMGWHASNRFHQPELEVILRDGLARFISVRIRTCVEALAVDEIPLA